MIVASLMTQVTNHVALTIAGVGRIKLEVSSAGRSIKKVRKIKYKHITASDSGSACKDQHATRISGRCCTAPTRCKYMTW